jgi:hypothetical protein
MTNKAKRAKPDNTLVIEQTPDETVGQAMARKVLRPGFRHALSASSFAGKSLGDMIDQPSLMDYITYVQSATAAAAQGDLAIASRMLAGQAIALDSMFTELARRAAANMGDYIHAAERYGRLALKAQSNCRATLEALAKLHQPREQTVRHVHVNEGGQAVVADHFHHHTGGHENAKSDEQSHATSAVGASSALPSPDPLGSGVPIASGENQAAMQDARRK